MPLPLGTCIPVQDGFQWIRYNPALAVMGHVHGAHLEVYHPRIKRRSRVVSLSSRSCIWPCIDWLDIDEPHHSREEQLSRLAGCHGYFDNIVCGDYLFLLGIFFMTYRCSVLRVFSCHH
jgi:hypothetical protein